MNVASKKHAAKKAPATTSPIKCGTKAAPDLSQYATPPARPALAPMTRTRLEAVRSTASLARSAVLHRLANHVDALAHVPSDRDGEYTPEALAEARVAARTGLLEVLTYLDHIENDVANVVDTFAAVEVSK